MCGHDGAEGPGTQREKNIRGDSQDSHGTSTHTSFFKSLTKTPLNLPLTHTHTHAKECVCTCVDPPVSLTCINSIPTASMHSHSLPCLLPSASLLSLGFLSPPQLPSSPHSSDISSFTLLHSPPPSAPHYLPISYITTHFSIYSSLSFYPFLYSSLHPPNPSFSVS